LNRRQGIARWVVAVALVFVGIFVVLVGVAVALVWIASGGIRTTPL